MVLPETLDQALLTAALEGGEGAGHVQRIQL